MQQYVRTVFSKRFIVVGMYSVMEEVEIYTETLLFLTLFTEILLG